MNQIKFMMDEEEIDMAEAGRIIYSFKEMLPEPDWPSSQTAPEYVRLFPEILATGANLTPRPLGIETRESERSSSQGTAFPR